MASNLDALYIDIVSPVQIKSCPKAETAIDLCQFGSIGCCRRAAVRIVLAQDTGVLGGSSEGDGGITTTRGASAGTPGIPGPFAGCCVPSDSPRAAPDDNGITTSD